MAGGRTFGLLAIFGASLAGCGEDKPAPSAANTPGYISPVLEQPVLARPTKLQDSIANAPAWAPSEAMKGVLSNQWVAVGPYKLQVPNGYTTENVDINAMMGGGSRIENVYIVDISPPQTSQLGVHAELTIDVSPRMAIGNTNLDGFTLGNRQKLDSIYRNINATDSEVGKLAGIGFSRFAWTGTEGPTGQAVKGVEYSALDGPWEINLRFQAGANDDVSMFAFEAASLSFLRQ